MVQERDRSGSKRVKIQEFSEESEVDSEVEVDVEAQADSQEATSSQLSSLTGDNPKEIDPDLLAVLQKQLSKRKEDRQKKLLANIEKHLRQEQVKTTTEIVEIVQNVNELHDKFLLDYAACDDRIRKIWTKIFNEEDVLVKFMRDRKSVEEEKYEVPWGGQLAGLSKMRTGYKAFQGIVKELANECSDVSDMRGTASALKERA